MLRFLKSVQIAQILLKNSADPDSGQGSQFPVPEFLKARKKPQVAVENIRCIFPYTVEVWNLPQPRLCDFAARCKECGETIPAPVRTMPGLGIVVAQKDCTG
jgi:hypothetical protein